MAFFLPSRRSRAPRWPDGIFFFFIAFLIGGRDDACHPVGFFFFTVCSSFFVRCLQVCFAFFLDELPNTDAQLGAAEIAQV